MARDGRARRRPQDAATQAGQKASAQDRGTSPAPMAITLTVVDRPFNTRPYPWLTAAPELRPPARSLPPPFTDSSEPVAATPDAGPAGPDDASHPDPFPPAATERPAIATVMSELLFAVARYLSGTPCQRAFQALVAELNEHRLLPPAISWTGEPRALTYADLVRVGVALGRATGGPCDGWPARWLTRT